MLLRVSLFGLPKQFHHDAGNTCIVYFQIRVFVISEPEFFGCVCKPVICVVFLCPTEMQFRVEFPTQSTWLEVLTEAVSIGILRKVSLRLETNMLCYFFFYFFIFLKKYFCRLEGMFRTCLVKILGIKFACLTFG